MVEKEFVGKALCIYLDNYEVIAFIKDEYGKIRTILIPEADAIEELSIEELNKLLHAVNIESIYEYEFPEDDPLYYTPK